MLMPLLQAAVDQVQILGREFVAVRPEHDVLADRDRADTVEERRDVRESLRLQLRVGDVDVERDVEQSLGTRYEQAASLRRDDRRRRAPHSGLAR